MRQLQKMRLMPYSFTSVSGREHCDKTKRGVRRRETSAGSASGPGMGGGCSIKMIGRGGPATPGPVVRHRRYSPISIDPQSASAGCAVALPPSSLSPCRAQCRTPPYKLALAATRLLSVEPSASTPLTMPPSIRSALINEEAASPASRPESTKDDKEDVKDLEVQCGPTETRYSGSGTAEDPYVVDWHPDDPENPYNWSKTRRWVYTFQVRKRSHYGLCSLTNCVQ